MESPSGAKYRDQVMNRSAAVDQRPRHPTRTATPAQMADKEQTNTAAGRLISASVKPLCEVGCSTQVMLDSGPRDVAPREMSGERIGDVAETGAPQVFQALRQDDDLGTHEASLQAGGLQKASSLCGPPAVAKARNSLPSAHNSA
jgi:hypothetical protein